MEELDLDRQAEDIGINRSSLLSLYFIFINQTESDLKELSLLIERRDREAVGEKAHHIKGASINLEIDGMARCALSIQEMCRNNEDWQAVSDQCDSLNRHFHMLKLQIAEADNYE